MISELFADYKHKALEQIDCNGENILFECAKNGYEEIYKYYMGTNEFYKARALQNFRGRTIEHVVCLHKQHPIVDEINPRPDTKDFYGSLPLFYAIQADDTPMLKKQFTSGSLYFPLRNYKFETMFHIAAKHNARDSLEFICGINVFIQHLVKRDYKGDTCFHAAAKAGSYECLEWLLSSVTSKDFIEIENDFGQTPLAAAE